MKKHIVNIIIIAIVGLFAFNCGHRTGADLTPDASRKTIGLAPDWFLNVPEVEGFKYVSSTATSQDMQMAINKASLDAGNRLAGQVESEMSALVKRATEETGLNFDSQIIDQFSQTQEQIISTSLKDWKVKNKDVQEEKSDGQRIYRAYVLIEWDEGAAQKRLLAKIKADEQLYTAMRATELFDEMENKVEAYRERYNK